MSDNDPEARRPTLAHRLHYALFRAAEGLLGCLSLRTAARAGEWLGLLAWACFVKKRRLVERNLRVATVAAAPGPAEIRRRARATFRRAGGNMLGGQRAATMRPDQLRRHLEFEGLDHLAGPAAAGRGMILVMAHMGNWEVLAQLVPELAGERPSGSMYRPLENPLLDQLTRSRRIQQGAEVFSKHDGFHEPAALLRQGGTLAVMSDQRAGGHGQLCPFFGRLSSCTPLPALLARRANAAMTTVSVSTLAPGRWKIRVRPVPDRATTAEVIGCLETAMRDDLTDVFWFHDRWRIDKERPLSFFTKEMPTEAARTATVPTRLVATLPAGNPAAVETLLALLEMRPDLRIDLLDPGDLPGLPDDPRLIRRPWDRKSSDQQAVGLLEQCDLSHPAPLDFALLLDGDERLARAAAKLGLRAVIGTGVSGKYWTRRFPVPAGAEDWRLLASGLVRIKRTRIS